MPTDNIIIENTNDFLNNNVPLAISTVEIDDQSDNSSLLSYTDLSNSIGMEISSPSTVSVGSTASYGPFLAIEEQPKGQLRFRYKSERGCHGGLKPIVKLINCDSKESIWIKATLYTCGNPPTLHVFDLDGKSCENGSCFLKLSKDFTARFPPLSICTKKKEEMAVVLKGRIKQRYKEEKKRINEKEIEKEVSEKMKTFNSNSGKLYFEAFYNKDESKPVCESGVFSSPIYNQKGSMSSDLKITRLSSFSGKTSGNEDMILLCEKIRKEDIEIIFSCQKGNMNWEEKADFKPADVHHQVAIPFKTPRFIENIEQEVFIRLHRKSDGKDGEPRAFVYKQCDDFEGKPSKRKRLNPPEEVSGSTTQDEPSTSSSTLLDEDLLPPDSYLNEILASCINDSPFAELDFSQYSLPFDNVTMDSILDLATLKIGEKTPVQKKNVKEKCTTANTSSHETKVNQMLKTGVLSLLRERESKTFLKFLPSLLSMKDDNGNTLLHLVVIEKSENLPLILKMVEAAPASLINKTNKEKMTPLHIAVSKGLWKVARILLMLGADPNVKDRNGNTCTHLAAKYCLPWCLGEVLAPLLGAKKREPIPDVNVLNYDGLAPLHISIENNSIICTKLLIQAKADINIPDGKCGKTPLHFAYKTNYKLVKLLVSLPGIDQTAEDFHGKTPYGIVPKLEKYSESDEDHHVEDSKGKSPKTYTRSNVHTNSTLAQKPTECCIELSIASLNCNEGDFIECKKEKNEISENDHVEEKKFDESSEDLFCKTLDSNGLWKKLGLYIMDEKELNVIGIMDSTPTKTLLNELKEPPEHRRPTRKAAREAAKKIYNTVHGFMPEAGDDDVCTPPTRSPVSSSKYCNSASPKKQKRCFMPETAKKIDKTVRGFMPEAAGHLYSPLTESPIALSKKHGSIHEASKKISNTEQGFMPEAEDNDVNNPSTRSPVSLSKDCRSLSPKKLGSMPEAGDDVHTPSTRSPVSLSKNCNSLSPKKHPSKKITPIEVDLFMECHEEGLSQVQTEAELKSQAEYDMVIQTLISLKASNVKIIFVKEPYYGPSAAPANIMLSASENTTELANNPSIQIMEKALPS